jgi:hypothetical protein
MRSYATSVCGLELLTHDSDGGRSRCRTHAEAALIVAVVIVGATESTIVALR